MGYAYKDDIKVRVESAWSSVDLYDVVIVIFDVHRHLSRLVTPHLGFEETSMNCTLIWL